MRPSKLEVWNCPVSKMRTQWATADSAQAEELAHEDFKLVRTLHLEEVAALERVEFSAACQELLQEAIGVKSRPLPLAVDEERAAPPEMFRTTITSLKYKHRNFNKLHSEIEMR